MRSIIAILLAAAFMLQSASKLIILAHYSINKEYISKNLCENKQKPKMHCNGKCHLKKQLQKEDKKENSTPAASKDKADFQLFAVKRSVIVFKQSLQDQPETPFLLNIYSAPLSRIFRPPLA
jgi:hypothetical protein